MSKTKPSGETWTSLIRKFEVSNDGIDYFNKRGIVPPFILVQGCVEEPLRQLFSFPYCLFPLLQLFIRFLILTLADFRAGNGMILFVKFSSLFVKF